MVIERPGLGIYITVTYLSKESFVNIVKHVVQYSDFLEIGIPTFNPKYDRSIIRTTHFKAKIKLM